MKKNKLIENDEPSLNDQISEHYKKFFAKFNEINNIDVVDWKIVHLLAYVCEKYENHYGVKYSFKFDKPAPSKSYEVYQFQKLGNMLSSNPKIIKEYIDWVFKSKIIEKKKRITSLGYFTHIDIVNEYKFKFLINKNIQTVARTDVLPQNITAACARHGSTVRTYGQLAFLKKMPGQEDLFKELINLGFKMEVLDKIV
jgi:hypothetical protein